MVLFQARLFLSILSCFKPPETASTRTLILTSTLTHTTRLLI